MKNVFKGIAVLAVALMMLGSPSLVPSGGSVSAEPSADEAMYMGKMVVINSLLLETFTYGGDNADQIMSDPQKAQQFVAGFYVWMYVEDVFETIEVPSSFSAMHDEYAQAVYGLDSAAPGCITGVNLLDPGLISTCTSAIVEASQHIQNATALLPQGL